MAETAPVQLASANEISEHVTSRELPERTAFTGYNEEAENSACIEAGGELIAQLNAAQAHKMCSFLIQKAKAGWLIL